MRTQIQTVTPEIAASFLQNNVNNRIVRKSAVMHLARIIKNGEWQLSHQGIAIDTSGNLLDGQHRLMAIIESGMSVQIAVNYDVHPDVFSCTDVGVKRSLSDVTRINKKTAEICSLMARFLHSNSRAPQPTAKEANLIYTNGIGIISNELNAFANTNTKFYSSVPFRLAAVILVMDGHDKEYVFNTYYNIVTIQIDKLSTISQSLMRQVHNNSISTHDKLYTVARALKVLDASRANNQLTLTTYDLASVVPYVRSVYLNYQLNNPAI